MKFVSDIVLALATIVLAYATINLARYTKAINEREKKNKREEDLRKCINSAHIIVTQSVSDTYGIAKPETERTLHILAELLALRNYFQTQDTLNKLQMFYADMLSSLGKESFIITDDLYKKHEALQKALQTEIICVWQRSLGNYNG